MRFASSVIGRFAFASACDPMMKSVSKRFGSARVGCRRHFAYRAKQSHAEESGLVPHAGIRIPSRARQERYAFGREKLSARSRVRPSMRERIHGPADAHANQEKQEQRP